MIAEILTPIEVTYRYERAGLTSLNAHLPPSACPSESQTEWLRLCWGRLLRGVIRPAGAARGVAC